MKIRETLKQYPKENLTRTPTPLQFLPHLSEDLGLNFYLKRDDLTDLALGGDKPRKLEYEIAQAIEKGADYLVTCGSAQSNHARLTTAAARRLGLDVAVVLSHDQWHAIQGNLLTVYLMGARVEMIHTEDHWDLEEHALNLVKELETDGRKPHYIPVSGTTPHSSLGYISGALETLEQMEEQNIVPDAVYLPFGTGGIFTAMMLSFREKGIEAPFFGISVNRSLDLCFANLDKWWAALCELLDVDPDRPRGEFRLYDEFIGKEYADPTEAGLDAILKMATAEGILLDPVYSGKVFSGFLDHFEAGDWEKGQNILMLHSGGVPAIFAYAGILEEHMRKRGRL
ncbi:MAG: D-cysteine desulfhydrase family protein [Chloroflexi bacterium]|nr:D-cysteine desulfhydrase family protein [Chloroflexota bacterium]